MTGPSPRDLDGDILAYLAGDLDEAALTTLDQRLREDQAAARRFAELSTREVLLSSVLRMRAGHPDHPSSRLPQLQLRPAPRRKLWQWGLAAAASVLMATVLVVHRSGEPPVSAPVVTNVPASKTAAPASVAAVLTVVEIEGTVDAQRSDPASAPEDDSGNTATFGAVSGNGIRLASGSAIMAGDRILVGVASRVGLASDDGTRLDLGPMTTLRIASNNRDLLELERGEVEAAVAHRQAGGPLVFATMHARAEVLGTHLRLTTTADATRLQVDEGRVRMTRQSDGAMVDIGSGYAATASAAKDRPFLSVRTDSIAGGLALTSTVRFSTRFSDAPDAWPGVLGRPPGSPLGTMAVRTVRTVPEQDGQRGYFEMHGRPHPGAGADPITYAGMGEYVSFRYVTERFATTDLIELVAISDKDIAYRCRVRPRFETSTTAVMRLDHAFVTREIGSDGSHPSLPAGTPIASLMWRVVGMDGAEAHANTQLWIEDVVGFTTVGAVETTPTVVVDARPTGYRRTWDFDHGEPTDMSVLGGSWRRLPDGGVDGSGCMQVDTPEFAVSIDVDPPTVPVRITFDHSPCLPNAVGNYSVFVHWDSFSSLIQLRNIAKQLVLPMPQPGVAAYERVFEYLLPDHMEIRQRGERSAMSFFKPEPTARLQLLVIGLNRIDNLRIEEIDPAQAPPVDDMRAVLATVGDQRPGTLVTLPIPVQDPGQPPQAAFLQVVPGTSPWIRFDDSPAP